MSISTPPPPQKKKSGCGCFGCGCLIVVILVILFLALMGAGGYFGYQKAIALTSTAPSDVPTFNATDDLYNSAGQKVASLQDSVRNHQPASIHLSADEVNTLILRDPTVTQQQDHIFVSFGDDQVHLQGSIPMNGLFKGGFLKDRYFNIDTTFSLSFNSDTKLINVELHKVQVGDQATPSNLLPVVQAELTAALSAQMQKTPSSRDFLQQAKSIQIKNNELVIETK